jgi:hypothetical protein
MIESALPVAYIRIEEMAWLRKLIAEVMHTCLLGYYE